MLRYAIIFKMQHDPNKKTVVAAFDFDGTISYHDTLFYFLLNSHGVFRAFFNFTILLPVFIRYELGLLNRQQTKEKILEKFFFGTPIDRIKEMGKAFAATKLASHLRPNAMQRLKWHQEMGHRCILISASLDVYLEPWCKLNGFQDCITSKMQTVSGLATGKLEGINCRGPEKVRRLQELLGPRKNYYLYAYGDSDGDKEMLEFSDAPFYCNMPKI